MQPKVLFKTCLLAILLPVACYCFAQPVIPRFESLGINDGLPSSSVYSIIQDKKGFMWFGTPDGLSRYDGSTLKNFKCTVVKDGDIVNNYVRGRVLEDKGGNIWYGNETGIYRWNAITETVSKAKVFERKEFGNAEFQPIFLDSDDNIWLTNIYHGVFAYNIATGNLKRFAFTFSVDYNNVINVYRNVDAEGNIWLKLGDENAPLIFFNRHTGTYTNLFKDSPPDAVFYNKQQRITSFNNKLVYSDGSNVQPRVVTKTINNKAASFYTGDAVGDNYGRLWMIGKIMG